MTLTLTVLSFHRIAEVPVLAPLAVVAGRVFQALLAEAAEPVAGVRIGHVDVAVALAGLADVPWWQRH